MNTRRTSIRRLAAGAGALSLAMVGLAGTAAMAEPGDPDIANITGTTGTLTIHKHAGDPTGDGDAGDGTDQGMLANPLEGVTFTVQPVSHTDQDPIDLTTVEGWNLAQTATAANVSASPFSLGTATTTTPTDVNGVTSVTGLPYGLYLVTEADPGSNNIVSPIAPFLVSIPYPSDGGWLYNVHVYPKNVLDENPPTKTVTDPGSEIVVGDTVTWTVSKTLPALATDAAFQNVTVTDTLDPRLSITTGDVAVTLGSTTLNPGTDYTVDVTGQVVTVELTGALSGLGGGEELVVTLDTTVNSLGDSAEISNSALVNVNDSEQSTGDPAVYYGQIQVAKTDAGSGDALAGAVFELYAADGDGQPTGDSLGTATTNGAGEFDEPFSVWVGTDSNGSRDYVLVETQAPAGYVTPTGDAAETVVTVSVGEENVVQVSIGSVTNTKHEGPDLPLTGSTGTLLFTIVGIGLIVTGGTIAAVRHNRSKA